MKIQSTKEVTYNDTKSTSKTVIMTGVILEIYKNIAREETDVVYKYIDADGGLYSQEKYTVTKDEANAIFPLIANSLPDIALIGQYAYEMAMYYEGFKLKMAERFPELEVSDIEIINDIE